MVKSNIDSCNGKVISTWISSFLVSLKSTGPNVSFQSDIT